MINIKADAEVKLKAKKIAEELGLPLSNIINAFLKDFVRNKRIAFSVAPTMTAELESILGEVEKDIINNQNISKGFTKAKDAILYLRSL